MIAESAFPTEYKVDHGTRVTTHMTTGLTKRELFAAMALQSLISGCLTGHNVGFTVTGNISAAVEYADALILKLKDGNL